MPLFFQIFIKCYRTCIIVTVLTIASFINLSQKFTSQARWPLKQVHCCNYASDSANKVSAKIRFNDGEANVFRSVYMSNEFVK